MESSRPQQLVALLLAAPALGAWQGAPTMRAAAARGSQPRMVLAMRPTAPRTPPGSATEIAGGERVGVLLLNLGGPDTLDQVEPFLYNLFSDPEIITLPGAISWLNGPLAWVIAKSRAPSSKKGYKNVLDGGSPQLRTTIAQGVALEEALAVRGISAKSYIGAPLPQ